MKRRLCFSTLGCPDWTIEQVVEQAHDLGFSAIEVRGIGGELNNFRIPCFKPDQWEHTRELLVRCGVSICGFGTSVCFHNKENYQAALEEGRETIMLCNRLGTPFLRVFGDQLHPEEEARDEMRRIISGIETLCDYAEETGTTSVLLEVHGDFNSIEALTPVIERLGHRESFGLIWDVEHSYRLYRQAIAPFYRFIRPYIRHMHMKDCRMAHERSFPCLPGEGEVNLREILNLVEADGYEGYFSFEWEKRWHPELEDPAVAFPHYVSLMLRE